ncbi:MAG: hypothetical protein H0T42_00655 [Deltaproteobacteria bacterium]|nr:hypothetical protein [Deltaproteobacteria bacterium]
MRRVHMLLMLCGGCGDGVLAPDTAVATDSGRGGLVSLQFLSDLSELGGHTVYFQNADSSLVLAGRTTDDGRANAFMTPGGSVTLAVNRANLVALFTHVAVQPGDELVIDERTTVTTEPTTALLIRVSPDPGATFYDLGTSCGSADIRGAELQPVSVSLRDCGERADMLVRSFGNGVRYIYRDDVEIPSGATVVFAGPYQALEPATIVATGVEASITELNLTHSLIGGRRELYREERFITPASGTGSAVADVPLPVNGTSMIRLDPSVPGELSSQHVIEWGPSIATRVVDMGTPLRPLVERPRIDPERRAIVWTESPMGAVADAVLATFQWSPIGSGFNYQWTVVAPREEEPILRLPLLPREPLIPQGTLIDPYIFAMVSSEGGYARIRPRIVGAWAPGRMWPIDGSAGRVVYRDIPL